MNLVTVPINVFKCLTFIANSTRSPHHLIWLLIPILFTCRRSEKGPNEPVTVTCFSSLELSVWRFSRFSATRFRLESCVFFIRTRWWGCCTLFLFPPCKESEYRLDWDYNRWLANDKFKQKEGNCAFDRSYKTCIGPRNILFLLSWTLLFKC